MSLSFALLVTGPAYGTQSASTAYRFARSLLAQGHTLSHLFFYQDGVYSASNSVVTPQDEQDIAQQWRAFVSEHQLDGVVCIAAALRRGVLNNEEASRYQRSAINIDAPWALSGLGQLHDAIQDADRLICFGGP